MAGSFEKGAMPESINENILEFRREIQTLREKRKFDATVNDIDMEKIGKAEREIWLRYKKYLRELVSDENNIFDEKKVKKYQNEIQLFSDKTHEDSIEPAFKGWMLNRFFAILGCLQGALYRGPSETDEDVRRERADIFEELLNEKKEIFG
jgi:hypothetical protein